MFTAAPTHMKHSFSNVPKAELPRSVFARPCSTKTTFNAGQLIPIYRDEIYPGDTVNLKATAIARMFTLIYPLMDNLYLDLFGFYCPTRLIWTNFVKMMGEQDNPADSVSYIVPVTTSPASGFVSKSLYDYLGLPCVGQTGGGATITVSNLLARMYNLTWNQWFRDENLQNSVTVDKGDGPDTYSNYVILNRGKRHDYFTSCLPWTQKGTAASIALSGNATVKTNASALLTGAQQGLHVTNVSGAASVTSTIVGQNNGAIGASAAAYTESFKVYPDNLYADLSSVTAVTINALRLAVQTQKVYERDARGGTRYTEHVLSHFGVHSPDARLQRVELLFTSSTPINVVPIAKTSSTDGTSPQANLSAIAHATIRGNGFTKSFTEHGFIMILASVRADLTYQQGIHKMFLRSTRLDHYLPALAHLGEQAVTNAEIYSDGSGNDAGVFGYQERWAEMRYGSSMVTGEFRSTFATPLDAWHLAQKFTSLPALNSTFIQENPPIDRVIATSGKQQFYLDAFFDVKHARVMPTYSVPGQMDRF